MIDTTVKALNDPIDEISSVQKLVNVSTRERAYSILQQLNEVQLQGFVSMFGVYFHSGDEDGQMRKKKALDELSKMIHPVNDIDYEKELASYRNERYGT